MNDNLYDEDEMEFASLCDEYGIDIMDTETIEKVKS
jgi:hypothetical protein